MLKKLTVVDDLEAWIAALRSGKYQQGFGELYNPVTDRYCAIAVLGKVVGGDELRREEAKEAAERVDVDVIWLNDTDRLPFHEIAARLDFCVLQPMLDGTAPGLADLYPPADYHDDEAAR